MSLASSLEAEGAKAAKNMQALAILTDPCKALSSAVIQVSYVAM